MKNQNLLSPLSKATLLWLIAIFCFSAGNTQTTNISGVVNTYHSVVKMVPEKACVLVSNTAGLAKSRKVLLIQMKGASINSSTSAAFGDTTSLNNAGNYEVATICGIVDDSVFFVHNIINDYTPTTGKVQLVQFAHYVNANVTGPVTSAPWNNATGTGGVVALFAEQNITLNSDITVEGKGFAGGAYFDSEDNCVNGITNYVLNPTLVNQNGASKGEGVAEVAPTQNGGRGAPANGGGGGNNHNNGGGGGANLSAGGLGGGNSSKPVFGRCTDPIPGLGGKPLNSWNGKKIFMGGGGGAGHSNNAISNTKGAEGGGIIFIHAASLSGNSRSISAVGAYGSASFSDGAGGGGAAGTIILDVNLYNTPVTITASGGHGGDSFDGVNIERCYGAGGGGAGGVIYFTGAAPAATVLVTGGPAGVESQRDVGCVAIVAPHSGINGQVVEHYNYAASLSIAEYCATVLPVHIEDFIAEERDNTVSLHWKIAPTDNYIRFVVEKLNSNYEWKEFLTIQQLQGHEEYNALDERPYFGYNSYRLKVIQNNGRPLYSQVRNVHVGNKGAIISIYPNPAVDRILIKGDFAAGSAVSLLDISGKTILNRKTLTGGNAEIILPLLDAGIYILRINNSMQKLVIK